MSDFSALAEGSASLVLGLAVAILPWIPIWALLLWMAASPASWRWKAEMSWKRFLVPAAVFAAVIGGSEAWSWVMRDLIGPSRPTDQDVVYWVCLIQMGLAGIAVPLVALARASSGAAIRLEAQRSWRARGAAVILAWCALAAVLASLRASGELTAPWFEWCALAASSAVLVLLMVLLIVTIIDLRKNAPRRASASSRNT